MAKTALFSCLLLATAWGSVVTERTNTVCRTEGFDLPNSLLGGIAPALFAQVGKGTYGELQYSGASKLNMNDVVAPGVNAHSKPNTALIGLAGTTLDFLVNRLFGTTAVVANIDPSTTITPVAGKVRSFDLKSVWIGCGTTASEVASFSLPCIVTVTGTDVNGVAKSTETIGFGADQVYNSTMGFKAFEGWDKMISVTMKVIDSGFERAATVLFFDDLVYCPKYM